MSEYIDRESVLDALSVFNDYDNGNEHFLYGIETARELVESIRAADAQTVKHGRWITEYEPDGKPYCFHCSVCDSDFNIVRNEIAYDYCPDCGAKMDGEDNV